MRCVHASCNDCWMLVHANHTPLLGNAGRQRFPHQAASGPLSCHFPTTGTIIKVCHALHGNNHCNCLQCQPPAAALHLQQFASCFDNTHRLQPDMDIRTLVPTRMPFLHGSTGDASWRQPTKCKQLASALRRCMQTSVCVVSHQTAVVFRSW